MNALARVSFQILASALVGRRLYYDAVKKTVELCLLAVFQHESGRVTHFL
jgi:hypothetical protein